MQATTTTPMKLSTLQIETSEDVVRVRQDVRAHAVAMGFGLVEQTKIVTAASELARNMIQHATGGELHIEEIDHMGRRGLRLVF